MTKRWLVALFLVSGLPVAAASPGAERGTTGTLSGKVTDLEGRPLAGVPLWVVRPSEEKKDCLPPSASSGPDGSFTISALPPGAVELYACGAGYVHEIRTVFFRDHLVHLKLQPAATLRGRVLGPDGAPVAGVRLYPRETPGILEADRTIVSSFPHSSPPCPDTTLAISDADGRFELASLLPGRYHFDISADGLTTDELYPVKLSAGEVAEGLEIRLRGHGSPAGLSAKLAASRCSPKAEPAMTVVPEDVSRPGTVRVSGKVLDSTGRPVAGAEIMATQDDDVVDHRGTRKDGSFTLHVPRGNVELWVGGVEIPEDRKVDIRVGRRAVEGLVIRLEPASDTRVTGRLLGLAPGEEAEIVGVLSEPLTAVRARVEGDRFEIPLERGLWMLQAALYDAAGAYLRSVRWTVEIPSGKTDREMDLDLADAKAVPEEEP